MGKILDQETLDKFARAKELEGQNKYRSFADRVLDLPPMNYALTKDMSPDVKAPIISTWVDRLKDYLEACVEFDVKIGNESAYSFLGLTKTQIDDMVAGKAPYILEHRVFGEKVKQICAVAREQMSLDSKIPFALGIFQSKIYDGYNEVSTVINVSQEQLDEPQSPEELAQRYLKQIPMEDDNNDG